MKTASNSIFWQSVNCQLTLYDVWSSLIGSFKHKGLKRLYDKGDSSKLSAELLPKINRIGSLLDMATELEDLDLSGFRLHALKVDRKGYFAVSVNGDWRITFRFAGGAPEDVDLVDYH